MPEYMVTVVGDARETYYVQADSEDEALRTWMNFGPPANTEVESAEAIKAELA
jgi:hypothetical protein